MKRLFWLTLGAVVGVLVVRKLSARVSRLTPTGLARQVTRGASGMTESVRDAVRGFSDEVRIGMAEREMELRQATLLGEHRLDGEPDEDLAARPGADSDAKWRTEN